jgi:pilus assembly protein Flp/PilA
VSHIKRTVARFAKEESGATMVEYGVMIAVIAAVAIATLRSIGTKTNNSFTKLNKNLP